AGRVGLPVCIVAVDLDGLKQTNDTLGHEAGDRAIVALASALRSALRETDQLFRIGGDEFVVLAPGAPVTAADELMARAISFSPPVFSWGAADTTDGRTLADVLGIADARLYAKRRAVRYGAAVGTPGAPSNRGATRRPVE